MRINRQTPGPGQESVWDYPRPPRIEPVKKVLLVELAGQVIARTSRGYRVLETSHPPVYYFPATDVDASFLQPQAGQSYCEWKGTARYFDAIVGDSIRRHAAWSYPKPSPGSEVLRDAVAFYAALFDKCTVDGQIVTPQDGGFYGGWITPDIVGPFKGGPGTSGW